MFFSCFPIVNVNNICALKFVDDETEKNKRDNEKMHCGNECKRKKNADQNVLLQGRPMFGN